MTRSEQIDSQLPVVTVLMPVFNAEAYVEQTLLSVLGQTMKEFEFIVIDDGSTDNSLRTVEKYAALDRRLRVISRPNKGIVASLNEGISLARGKYIARIDADDTCDAQRLAIQVERMDADPTLVVLGSNAIETDPDGRRLGVFPVPLRHEDIDSAHLKGCSRMLHPSVMIRTDALRKVGGYREGFCPAEDLDLWIRMAELGRVVNLAELLLIRRLTLNGLSATRAQLLEDKTRQILIDAWTRRNLPGKPAFPTLKPRSISDHYRSWAWLAIVDGQPKLAREYARKALARAPYHPNTWRVFVVANGGYFAARWWWRSLWKRLTLARLSG